MFTNKNIKFVIENDKVNTAFERLMLAFERLSETHHMDKYTFYHMTSEFIEFNRKYIDRLLESVKMTYDNTLTVDIKRLHNIRDNDIYYQPNDGYISLTQVDKRNNRYTIITKCRFKYVENKHLKAYKYYIENENPRMFDHNPFIQLFPTNGKSNHNHKYNYKTVVIQNETNFNKFKHWLSNIVFCRKSSSESDSDSGNGNMNIVDLDLELNLM